MDERPVTADWPVSKDGAQRPRDGGGQSIFPHPHHSAEGKHSITGRPQGPLSLAGRVLGMKDAKHDPLRPGGAGGAGCR